MRNLLRMSLLGPRSQREGGRSSLPLQMCPTSRVQLVMLHLTQQEGPRGRAQGMPSGRHVCRGSQALKGQ